MAAVLAPTPEIVWQPIEGTSQALALDTRCHHTLYHGARGPGKTITQLMRYRRRVGIGYGPFWRGIIFDKEFKNLSDLVAQSKRFFTKFDDGAKFLESAQDYKWVWPTGEELLLRHIKKVAEYDGYHGHEYPFIGWNELTKWHDSALYEKMMACNRSSFTPLKDTPMVKRRGKNGKFDNVYATADEKLLPDIPLEVFSTTNPSGPGHGWVKRKFIDVAPAGSVVRTDIAIFNPRTQQDEVVTKTQVAIFGSYRENIYLAPEYVAELESITDENLRRAWLYGDWNVVAGGALDDLWRQRVHVKPQFKVPAGWRVDRAFDWGSSHPFSVGWFAEANGEQVALPDGTLFCPPAGTIIQIAEWYGTKEYGTNKGLMLSAPDIALGIKLREALLLKEGWIQEKPWPGPADNQIRDVRESDTDSIEKKMADKGIHWTESDKSPGSRKNGLQLMRDRLEAATRGEGPALYFMQNCIASITLLHALPRDPVKIDDVDTTAEDHVYDMVRYRVLKAAKALVTRLNLLFPT
jgi:hypothetical protein